MTHKKEIIRWASSHNNTQVWYKFKQPIAGNDDKWYLTTYCPSWRSDCHYVVDDEWAEIRKAVIDGKTIQKETKRGWVDIKFTKKTLTKNKNVNKYRIKPEFSNMPIDTKLLVWDNGEEHKKIRRYFSHFDKDTGKCMAFVNGLTSWTATAHASSEWDNYEIVEKGENDDNNT